MALIGANAIADFDTPADENGRLVTRLYDMTVDEVLARRDWKFAQTRAAIAANSTDPTFNYDAGYAMPADCLRVLECYINETPVEDWIREGSNILTNAADPDSDELQIVYIQKQNDPAKFTPHFAKLVAYELAMKMAMRRTQNRQLTELLKAERELVEREAWAVDAKEKYIESNVDDVVNAGR